MKTHVIQLDAHDDVISVRDKMSWAKTPRLVIVFPSRGRILHRTLDLRLLQRHAASLGARLALVTRSVDIQREAEGLGLPVFRTLASAQRSPWKEDKRESFPPRRVPRRDLRRMRQEASSPEAGWRTLPAVRVSLFTLTVLVVIGLFLPFFPSATIELNPRRRTQGLSLTISASLEVNTINLAGSLPAYVAFVVVEGSKATSSSGLAVIPDQPAKGMLRFTNLTTSVVGIPAGTVVRTVGKSPVRFRTDTDGVMAAGTGETLEIPAQALVAGSAGNLPADALIAIEGDLGARLTVTNPDPMAGGTDQSVAIPTDADRTGLKAALQEELRQQALHQFQTLFPEDVFFPDTLAIAQSLSEVYVPGEGQSGSLLTLTMRIQYQIQYSKASEIRSLATAVLDGNLPEGYETFSDALMIKALTKVVTGTDGVSRWEMQAERPVRARLDPILAAQMIQGLNPSKASRALEDRFELDTPPKIRMTPAWWPWLPLSELRVAFIIQ